MVKIIKTFFDKYNLSLERKIGKDGKSMNPVILSRNNQKAINELQKIITKFIPIYKKYICISCQKRINDAIILLQIYYKEHKSIEKKSIEKKSIEKKSVKK